MDTKKYPILIILLFICIIGINILSIRHKSLTYDEKRHYKYGYQILKLNSDRFEDSKMPFSAFNAIPRVIAEELKPILSKKVTDFLYDIKTGRYITIAFSILLAFYVFKWAKQLYGRSAGILALTLYAFSPNIIAHSRLITTDLYATCMITIALYYFWEFIRKANIRTAFISALTLGISQLAKYTCAYLYLIFTLIILCRLFTKIFFKKKHEDIPYNYFKKLTKNVRYILIFIITNIIIINAGFLFNRSFTPLAGYKFKSELFKKIQKNAGILKHIPLMLPYPFIEGLDWVKYNERSGVSYSNIYLFEKIKTKKINQEFHGFKNYYLYAFLFKVPLPIQILFVFSICTRLIRYKRYDFINNEIFLLIPILFFFIYFNFFFNAQLGIRFLLVIFPLLHIFCAGIIKTYNDSIPPIVKTILTALILWLITSTISYFPHYISYFNELVWDRKKAYKILADSNIDWGQNVWYLEEYKKKHPEAKIEPAYPTTGTIVVSVNSLVGIFNPVKYKWLRDNFEPIDHIAYSYLIYKITKQDLLKLYKKYYKNKNY